MSRCCYADEYGQHFTAGAARRQARRFQRRGLRGTARTLADGIERTGLADASVLEVGGGVGDLQAHLLLAGAVRTTNVELSPNAEAAAEHLFSTLGLADRVDRRVGDFVEEAVQLPAADLVVLHRVICCYPDWGAMTGAAVERTRHAIGITIPVDRRRTRAVIAVGNRYLALRGLHFRAYVHPAAAVIDVIERAGFEVVLDRSGLVWRTVVLQRCNGTHT
ncbi:class I SAM-dependent methyltransferase [Nitriliruptor alkaliphilus]|uniref:class I SAM-dependent methyltransferase n=1 Tax=Nitriliruptor alkaliphilus TaxID=427918 RepID=UPI000696A481|nr:methyltransferase domain-containing protein [Nitriliruptor alkaliphilus]